jgi:hypothetical protein
VHLEASTKLHVHQKFEIFWINIASTMACPNFKNGPKTRLRPLGVKILAFLTFKILVTISVMLNEENESPLIVTGGHMLFLK